MADLMAGLKGVTLPLMLHEIKDEAYLAVLCAGRPVPELGGVCANGRDQAAGAHRLRARGGGSLQLKEEPHLQVRSF